MRIDHSSKSSDFLLLMSLALLLNCVLACQSRTSQPNSPRNKRTEQLINLDNNWLGAYKIGDTVTLKKLLAEDFQLTLETGQHFQRSALFATFATDTGAINNYQQRTTDLEIAFFNTYTAVLSGVLVRDYLAENGQTTLRFRFTDTFVRQKGQWKLVASHLSRLEF